MVTGLIGKKVGMTQLFAADGTVSPATVLKAGPCVVAQVKIASSDGYEAVQLGLVESKPSKENKPSAGHFKKAGVPATRVRREVKVKEGGDPAKAGDIVNVSIFANGDRVDVVGTSRGKGFQGVVKRHHFKGQSTVSHGCHEYERHGGAVSSGTFPGRVLKNKRMPGQYGDERVTTRNLRVARIDAERNLIFLRGAVPGHRNGLVRIRSAVAPRRSGAPKKG